MIDPLGGKGTTNLPMMPKWISQTPQSPAVFLAYRENLGCTSFQRPCEDSIRIRDGQDHSYRAATERLGAEVAMLRRLVAQPKLRAINGALCHHSSTGLFPAISHCR